VVGISAAGPLKERTDDCGGVIVVLPAKAAEMVDGHLAKAWSSFLMSAPLIGGEVT
jgi:hypothetical protein